MAKKFLTLFMVGVMTVISLLSLIGCGNSDEVRYNAEIIDIELKDEVIESNRRGGTFYYVNEYDQETGEYKITSRYTGKTDVGEQYYIIRSNEEMDNMCVSSPEINFDTEMIIIFFYVEYYPNRERKLVTVKADETELLIEHSRRYGSMGRGDAGLPTTGYMIMKMDKIDIETITIKEVAKYDWGF